VEGRTGILGKKVESCLAKRGLLGAALDERNGRNDNVKAKPADAKENKVIKVPKSLVERRKDAVVRCEGRGGPGGGIAWRAHAVDKWQENYSGPEGRIHFLRCSSSARGKKKQSLAEGSRMYSRGEPNLGSF